MGLVTGRRYGYLLLAGAHIFYLCLHDTVVEKAAAQKAEQTQQTDGQARCGRHDGSLVV